MGVKVFLVQATGKFMPDKFFQAIKKKARAKYLRYWTKYLDDGDGEIFADIV